MSSYKGLPDSLIYRILHATYYICHLWNEIRCAVDQQLGGQTVMHSSKSPVWKGLQGI